MKTALLYEKLEQGKAQCHVCQRRCIIPEGKSGYCQTRANHHGEVYSLIYGKVASMAVSPIEKKPMFHFYPGSLWLSLGSYGCNFRCPGCQNWELAHAEVEKAVKGSRSIHPEDLVRMAENQGCKGISWTYNEPTLWLEYTLDGAKLARERGLLTNYVTNGYIAPEAFDLMGPLLDSFRVDVKGFSQEAYRYLAHIDDFTGILGTAKRAKEKWGMHVEIVTNVIPEINDSEKQFQGIASWIRDSLGKDTPWHVTRFYPHHHLSHLSTTSIAVLEKGRRIGLKEGLAFVYLGNVPGHEGENTYCPGCRKLLIHRYIFDIIENYIVGGKCSYCGCSIPGRF